jgi:hypothetical protein
MNTKTKPSGRNYVSRYSPVLLDDAHRCHWSKEYGLTVCGDPAEVDVTFAATQSGARERTYGYCSFHGPKAVVHALRQTGRKATMKAR